MRTKTIVGVLALGLMMAMGTVACGSPPPASPPTTSADLDSDDDGVPDIADKCPGNKEDGKGTSPKDGCPDVP